MKIVTAGETFTDIDAYAGCIAYAELLRIQGFEAEAVLPGILNDSVPRMVRNWPVKYSTARDPVISDEYILIDVSDPKHFANFVNVERVAEVIDHHPGFENYWVEKLGNKADIVEIGAACTQIYQRWLQAGKLAQMDRSVARVLICGILDNTLNFKAEITTDEDRSAYTTLSKIAQWSEELTKQYFLECQKSITSDLATAIKNDAKIINMPTQGGSVDVGQLVVWDAAGILSGSLDVTRDTLHTPGRSWFMNLVSIGEGVSYIITDIEEVKLELASLLGIKFDGKVAKANRLWLRKELMRRYLEVNSL